MHSLALAPPRSVITILEKMRLMSRLHKRQTTFLHPNSKVNKAHVVVFSLHHYVCIAPLVINCLQEEEFQNKFKLHNFIILITHVLYWKHASNQWWLAAYWTKSRGLATFLQSCG